MSVALQRTDVFGIMHADLERVNARVIDVARIDFPIASALVRDIVDAGGKRLRPLLLLLAGYAYEYDTHLDQLITAAAGVELLHTASLIHDDTVDRAAIRRGKPTLNSQLSSGAVILIGDFLFAQSAMLAAATGIPRVVSVFASTLGDICDGQLREMFDAHRLDQSREDYERRIYGKTASLFAGAAEMGAVLGEAPEEHVQALRSYGSDVGLAFQIVDDLLDVTGGSADLGKPAGNDLRQGTVTLPTLLYAGDLARDSEGWDRLENSVTRSNDDGEIDQLLEEIRLSGAVESSYAAADAYVERAKAHISIVPDSVARDMLLELADFVVQRHS